MRSGYDKTDLQKSLFTSLRDAGLHNFVHCVLKNNVKWSKEVRPLETYARVSLMAAVTGASGYL